MGKPHGQVIRWVFKRYQHNFESLRSSLRRAIDQPLILMRESATAASHALHDDHQSQR
jgi:hypothetical protein